MISTGKASVHKYFTSREKIKIGELNEGVFIGEVQVTFDSDPLFSIEATSYCNVGHVCVHGFKEIFSKFP